MRLPDSLQASIGQLLEKASPHSLKRAREALSREYREEKDSSSIFADEGKRLAYLATRFPATYSAAHKVLAELRAKIPASSCKRILDLGAGPGTAAWAALELFPEIEELSLIERSPEAILLGKEISKGISTVRKELWIASDLHSVEPLPPSDLVLASYALGELKNPQEVVARIWKSAPSYFIIIEPGSPRGYHLILSLRDLLLKSGAHLIAPCPHSHACPLTGGDWCHFPARVERTSLHRLLKEGSLGHEDEKYSFLAVSRVPLPSNGDSRILRHPHKGSGHVRMVLCHPSGKRIETTVSRKMKESYKQARDAEWGDSFSFRF